MKTNWKTQLKEVLGKDEFSEISAKTALTKTDKTRINVVSSVFVSGQLGHFPKNNDYKAEKIHEVLNRFIEKGTTFDVSENDFQVIDPAQILKTSDKDFLKLNDAAILCTLQQSLLMKHLFSHSPEQFEDFSFEIAERECLKTPLRITDKTRFEIYFEAVESTTRKWFEDLLKNYD